MRRLSGTLTLLLLISCSSPGRDDPEERSSATRVFAPSPQERPTSFIAAVGDIACAPGEPETPFACHQEGTAALLDRGAPLGGTGLLGVLLLGDTQYESGTTDEYRVFDDTWGRVLERTGARILPVTGNHEYNNEGSPPSGCRLHTGDHHACAFGAYFSQRTDVLDDGDAQYAVTFGEDERHPLVVIVLDVGRCDLAPEECDQDGPVARFLRSALADPQTNPPQACTVVAWHQARWSELGHGDLSFVDPVWRALFGAPARQRPDLVLNGHDHMYERYPPLGPDGELDRSGIAELVVGTGGREIIGVQIPSGRLEAIDTSSFGVLRVGWSGRRGEVTTSFVTERGRFEDRTTHPCRG